MESSDDEGDNHGNHDEQAKEEGEEEEDDYEFHIIERHEAGSGNAADEDTTSAADSDVPPPLPARSASWLGWLTRSNTDVSASKADEDKDEDEKKVADSKQEEFHLVGDNQPTIGYGITVQQHGLILDNSEEVEAAAKATTAFGFIIESIIEVKCDCRENGSSQLICVVIIFVPTRRPFAVLQPITSLPRKRKTSSPR